MSFTDRLERALGFLPGAVAVMGKWEPFMRGERCLEEVAARAAAALAVAEALEPGRLFLLSAEGRLRGQPRPGSVIAAQILVRLGADPARVRCCPGANLTWVELQVLDRMVRELNAGGLLLVTAGYHVERTRALMWRLGPRLSNGPRAVIAVDDPLIGQALAGLDPGRARRLQRVIGRGLRNGQRGAALGEAAARMVLLAPGLQQLVADLIRGRARPDGVAMFCPELPPGLAGRPLELQALLKGASRRRWGPDSS